MWRAWGTALLLLSQDLDRAYYDSSHGFEIRPPDGWDRKPGQGALLAYFRPREELKIACVLEVKYLRTTNPTPLKSFATQAKVHIRQKDKDVVLKEEGELKINGRNAYRFVFKHGDRIDVKTIIPRSNLEFYLIDGTMALVDAPRFRPSIEASVASFLLSAPPLSESEEKAVVLTRKALRGASVKPALLGEWWYAVYLGARKTGHARTKVSEEGGRYVFEMDVINDFGKGGLDRTIVRGAFSPDGSWQKIDREQTKKSEKRTWQFRAVGELKDGKVTVSCVMDGVKENRTFPVEPGTLFSDVAGLVRRALVIRGPGTYFLRTLSPFSDTPDHEMVEVTGAETVRFNDREESACTVFAVTGRSRNQTYTYASDGRLLRQGGPKDMFSLRATTKEKALK